MDKVFKYTCACCGEEHEGAPGFGYTAPAYYREDDANCELTADFCSIDNEHFFVRATLDIPIIGYPEPFNWGIWVSLKRENFDRYRETFDDPVQEGSYFGWFSNALPWYPDTLSLPTTVHFQSGGHRPWIELEPGDHLLCGDYHNGISWKKAIEIAQIAMHGHDA